MCIRDSPWGHGLYISRHLTATKISSSSDVVRVGLRRIVSIRFLAWVWLEFSRVYELVRDVCGLLSSRLLCRLERQVLLNCILAAAVLWYFAVHRCFGRLRWWWWCRVSDVECLNCWWQYFYKSFIILYKKLCYSLVDCRRLLLFSNRRNNIDLGLWFYIVFLEQYIFAKGARFCYFTQCNIWSL